MEPEQMERELQELDAELLMELAGLLNLFFDKLLQDLQPLIKGSGSGDQSIEELKKSLLELRDSLNASIFNLNGREVKSEELPFKASAVEINSNKGVEDDSFISVGLTGNEETEVIENTKSTVIPTEEGKIEKSALNRSTKSYNLNE